FRLNEGLWRYISIWDLRNIATGVLTSTVLFYACVRWWLGVPDYPRSIFIIDSVLLIGFITGIRLPSRILRESAIYRRNKRVLIIGAGDSGERIVREMKTHGSHRYHPIGFVDDNPALRNKRIHGVKVFGTRKELPRILAEQKPEEVMLALPGAKPTVVSEVVNAIEPFNVA